MKATGFVGHDLSFKGSCALRVVPFQGQSRLASPEATTAATRFAIYLQVTGADLALISETGLRDGSQQFADFKGILRKHGYIALNHYPNDAPNGKGVMIVTRLEHPPRPKSVKRDTEARGIAATIAYRSASGSAQVVPLRAIACYATTGMTSMSGPALDGDRVADWLTADVRRQLQRTCP